MFGENNPSHYQYHTWDQVGIDSPWHTSVSSEGKPVVYASKYLDVRLSEMHGIPIYIPLHSGARRNVVPTGYVHGQFRDQLFQSPGNSSQVLPAGSARPGGTTVPPILPTRTINRMMKMSNSADRSRWRREGGACPSGYELKKVKGKWMCVRKSSKKSRSR